MTHIDIDSLSLKEETIFDSKELILHKNVQGINERLYENLYFPDVTIIYILEGMYAMKNLILYNR